MLSKCNVGLLLRTQAISYLSKYICRKAPRSETTRTFKGDGRGMVSPRRMRNPHGNELAWAMRWGETAGAQRPRHNSDFRSREVLPKLSGSWAALEK